MHEIGMGASGHNAHHGPVRNPYHPERATGGSSSGSAAAIAAGLCPAAIGTDGGGSIRIPAALCGLVGLKPTFGRVSGRGATLSCWSVAHVGPLAASADDAALLYQAIAGPDRGDPGTWHQPAPTLEAGDLRGLKLGLFRPWFEHAAEPIVQACSALLAQLVGRGAEVVEVNLPYLGTCAVAHMVTIATEMAAAHARGFERDSRAYGPEVRFNLALARRLRATDYVQAQRLRALVLEGFLDALRRVDAIVSPAVACLAPALVCGDESDLVQLDQLMRFARPANLTGLPAISFPVGYDADGMPIGMQAIGRPWDEATLLAIARAAEAVVPRRAPATYRPLIG
jgi:Asp-tRNA(Asn)/Glu-tRNA(Gln) amidotransferase A subunit family amidase